jgi:flagellar motor switch protein FliG
MAAPATEAVPMDIQKMTKVQKLATLLIILGPEGASQVLKHLDEHELEAISTEMAKISMIPQELQKDILREFSGLAVDASASILGGVDYTRHVLEKSLGVFRASDIVGRVSPTRTPVAAMQPIIEMDPRQIFNLIKNEQHQTIALIASYLPSAKTSELLTLLRAEARDQVVERLATLAPTPIEVVERVVEVLNLKAGGRQTRALSQTGGVKSAADILNSMDKNLSKSLLVTIEERNPELGQAIRQKMFIFEDLAMLDVASLQKILRDVDMRELAVSLKTASEKLKKALLGCMSKRAAEALNEEINFMGALKLKDIESAQQRIIEAVRRLEAEGEVDLSGGGGSKDEVVA